MAQHSGFFNALKSGETYDRKYNAKDYSDNLAVIISNGVLRTINDDLKPSVSSSLVSIAAGRGWINGHYYLNDSPMNFTLETPISGARYDRVILRLNEDINARTVSLRYLKGVAGTSPQKPALIRSGDTYDLCIAEIYLTAGSETITLTDTRSDPELCGWVYSTAGDQQFLKSLDTTFYEWFTGAKNTLSSVTLYKKYEWSTTLTAATQTVAFDIPQYNPETCYIEVFVNGIINSRFTRTDSVLTFAGTLIVGTEVTVKCYKSIDGTGIMTVGDEITELQNQFSTLQGVTKFVYNCNGSDDNVSLSQIAQAFYDGFYGSEEVSTTANAFLTALGGNTYLGGLADDAQITIDVVGRLGVTAPFGGRGGEADPYIWFVLGPEEASSKRIIFDFAKCEEINISLSILGFQSIFYGTDLYVKNANVRGTHSKARANGIVKMVDGTTKTHILGEAIKYGQVNFENCRLVLDTGCAATIASRGNYRDCYMYAKSSHRNAFCIDVQSYGLTRLNGGTYYAYGGNEDYISAIINIDANQSSGYANASNVNCPKIELTGYNQNYFINAYGGVASAYLAATTLNSAGYYNIEGLIPEDFI